MYSVFGHCLLVEGFVSMLNCPAYLGSHTCVIWSAGNLWTETACRRGSEPRGERCRLSSHFLWTSKHQLVWKRTPELTSCSWWHNPLSLSSSESGILTKRTCGETESPKLKCCKSHQTASLVGNSDIHPCLCLHTRSRRCPWCQLCYWGSNMGTAAWCNLEITTMIMTTLTEQIA